MLLASLHYYLSDRKRSCKSHDHLDQTSSQDINWIEYRLRLQPTSRSVGNKLCIRASSEDTKHRDYSFIHLQSFTRIKLSMERKKQTALQTLFKRKKHITFLALTITILLLTSAFSPEIEEHLSKEDGWIENITTFALFATTTLGTFLLSKKILGKRALIFISLTSFLAFLSEISFGERLFNLDMPHPGGKQLDGVHDLLHMLQKIYIVNGNYHPTETLIATTILLALAATLIYTARSKISKLNNYLKTLKIRSIVAYAISFAVVAQALDLGIVVHENHRILEEILELLAALCLAASIIKIKSLNHSKTKRQAISPK